jgi:hypothetical protein
MDARSRPLQGASDLQQAKRGSGLPLGPCTLSRASPHATAPQGASNLCWQTTTQNRQISVRLNATQPPKKPRSSGDGQFQPKGEQSSIQYVGGASRGAGSTQPWLEPTSRRPLAVLPAAPRSDSQKAADSFCRVDNGSEGRPLRLTSGHFRSRHRLAHQLRAVSGYLIDVPGGPQSKSQAPT